MQGSSEGIAVFCILLFFMAVVNAQNCNQDNDCSHGGTCQTGTCSCTAVWSGPTCRTCLNDTACLNNGTCESGICICPQGIINTDCSTSSKSASNQFNYMVLACGLLIIAIRNISYSR